MRPTTEQLQRLTDLINNRYAEFEIDGTPMFEPQTLGGVRLIWSAVEEWEEMDGEQAIIDAAYERGYRHGLEIGAFNEARAAGLAGDSALEIARDPAERYKPVMPEPNGSTIVHKNNGGDSRLSAVPTVSPSQAETMKQSPFGDDFDDLDSPDDDLGDGPDDNFDIGEEVDKPPEREMSDARREQLERRKRRHAARAIGRLTLVEKESEREPKRPALPTLEEVVREIQRISMGGVMPTQAQFDQARPSHWATAWAQIQRLKMSWTQLAEEAGLKPRKPGQQWRTMPASTGNRC